MAYNDWMVEEWCGDSQGRLLPLCLIPLWDPQLAASETRRNADRGVHAVCFTEGPDKLGLPSLHDKNHFWDPFLDACHETGTVICMHIGSSSQLHLPSPDAPLASVGATVSNNSIDALTDWLFSGALVRYPNLKIALAESQVGWIPYVLERCDHVWNTQRGMSEAVRSLPEPPSYYYYRQVFGCLYDDQFGLDNLDKVGEDNVTFETDYPHLDGTWPKSRQMADSLTKKLSPGQTYKLLRGNAINLFNLPLDGKDSKYVSIDTGVDQTKMGGAANAK
jgi:predicted TIM-barrel fold metal-dependent hydrolase